MTKNDIYTIFDVGGTLQSRFPSYEYREGQLLMAELVRQSYENKAILAVEAGTGIGKSFAYLVPAIYNAMEHPDEKTVIATSTINLQKQLFEKDIPMIFRLLDRSCKVALAVGRGNYLCIRRLLQKKAETPLLADDPTEEICKIEQWAKITESGLRNEYPGRLSDLWLEINSDGDLCQGRNCPYLHDCFYFKAKLKAKEANIVVSNHHLLFSDAHTRFEDGLDYTEDGILPPFNRLIIDEAHNIESNASEYFTEIYDSKEMKRQIAIIERKGGSSLSLLESLAPYAVSDDIVDRIHDDIALLLRDVDTLDQYLLVVFAKNSFQPVLIKAENQPRLDEFVESATKVSETSGRLASKINQLLEHNTAPLEFESKINEMKIRGLRLQKMSEVLCKFCNFPAWDDDIHWFNVETNKDKSHRVQVMITPLNISHMMVEAIFKKLDTVVCTSATMNLNDDFRFWGSRVGLPYDDVRPFLRDTFISPFDFRNRLLLLTPSDAPVFSRDDPAPYISYMGDTIFNCIFSAGGGTLVLFTSYSMLKAVKEQVEDRFKTNHMTLFCQGEMDRFTLLNNFIKDNDSNLFATSSFWEGIDAPGQTLRMVIIVKLPFQVPSDPVFKARCDALDLAGGSGFGQLGLPSATMKLKQGFGRLLRNKDDRGIVVILDSRVESKSYGTCMMRSLPESYHPQTLTSGLCEKIEGFLYNE
ncbi:MAG: ATP-dependent DNA helicase [Sphaerochaetaceae bacterium]